MYEYRMMHSPATAARFDAGLATLTGHAAVFFDGSAGSEYSLWPGAVERIDAGAFDAALKRSDDAAALFNHNPDHMMGRVSSGTLRLRKDGRGLLYEIDPPDTQLGRQVVTLTQRGDLRGSSFAFRVDNERWHKAGSKEIRTILDVTLIDVGPVVMPAYKGTSVTIGY